METKGWMDGDKMKIQEGDVAAIRRNASGDYYISYIPDELKIGDELPPDCIDCYGTREWAAYELRKLIAATKKARK